jgi:hypothetical protein
MPPGGGWRVAPGRYQMEIAYGKEKVQTDIWVEEDPRVRFEPTFYNEQKKLYNEWKTVILELDAEVEKVKAFKELMSWCLESMKYLPDSVQKPVKALSDSLSKSWNAQLDKVFMKEGLNGIQDDSKVISGRWWTPYALLSSEMELPGKNAVNAIAVLNNDVKAWKEENNVIWDKQWKRFVLLTQAHVHLPKEWKP